MAKTIKVHYEVRFKRKIKGSGMSEKIYPKDSLFCKLYSMEGLKEFIEDSPASDCLGHGVYNYFDTKRDFHYLEVTRVIKTDTSTVKLNTNKI